MTPGSFPSHFRSAQIRSRRGPGGEPKGEKNTVWPLIAKVFFRDGATRSSGRPLQGRASAWRAGETAGAACRWGATTWLAEGVAGRGLLGHWAGPQGQGAGAGALPQQQDSTAGTRFCNPPIPTPRASSKARTNRPRRRTMQEYATSSHRQEEKSAHLRGVAKGPAATERPPEPGARGLSAFGAIRLQTPW